MVLSINSDNFSHVSLNLYKSINKILTLDFHECRSVRQVDYGDFTIF